MILALGSSSFHVKGAQLLLFSSLKCDNEAAEILALNSKTFIKFNYEGPILKHKFCKLTDDHQVSAIPDFYDSIE